MFLWTPVTWPYTVHTLVLTSLLLETLSVLFEIETVLYLLKREGVSIECSALPGDVLASASLSFLADPRMLVSSGSNDDVTSIRALGEQDVVVSTRTKSTIPTDFDPAKVTNTQIIDLIIVFMCV